MRAMQIANTLQIIIFRSVSLFGSNPDPWLQPCSFSTSFFKPVFFTTGFQRVAGFLEMAGEGLAQGESSSSSSSSSGDSVLWDLACGCSVSLPKSMPSSDVSLLARCLFFAADLDFESPIACSQQSGLLPKRETDLNIIIWSAFTICIARVSGLEN